MTITPRHAHRRMTKQLATFEAMLLALPSALYAARQRDLDRLIEGQTGERVGRKGGISDPTGSTAVNVVHAGTPSLEDVEQYLDTIGLSLKLLSRFVLDESGIDLYDEAQAPEFRRCGQYTPRDIKLQDWYTTTNRRGRVPAECTDAALHTVADDGTVTWHTHGLCAADYQAMRRWLVEAGLLERGQEWVA